MSPVPPRGAVATRRVAAAVVVLLAAFAGYLLGVRSPWSAHHPHVVAGTATRVPADVPIARFAAEGVEPVWFRLDHVVWRDGDRTGEDGVPPCLRGDREPVDVEVGLIELSRPFGTGSYLEVTSLTCP